MNTVVLVLGVLAAGGVTALLLWIFLRPARPPKVVKAVPAPAATKSIAAPKKRAVKALAPATEAPSVEVPENTSSTRWVGALIDKHPD
ncbi:MAG: hypothetical protein HQ495_08860, partial [Alphaproteobacteria bacterium]|nr:hypothetical protein [Alphaproteobacteria bacterium]